MSSEFPRTLAIFCKVVDNYGDIGICWRLARQFHAEHGIAVTLWVDDLASFRRIWPQVDVDAAQQDVGGVTVRHWRGQDGEFAPAEIPDMVIEFFGVDLPPGYIAAMAQCEPRPVWINYEGLSAEEWVEGCHRLPSMHPRLKLTKHFFFPGFTDKTGGLLRERGLVEECARFQADPVAMAAFLAPFGVTRDELASLKVSLFCYPEAPVGELFAAWEQGAARVTCLVPEGVAREQVRAFIGAEVHPGAHATRGALTVRVIPFMPQTDYDRLLWACDLNFVRGEDSWVRAQWAARPFIWHIYPQDENLHHVKLRAFLQKYAVNTQSLVDFSLRWNGAREGHMDALWTSLQAELPTLVRRAREWEAQMLANGDLVSNLLDFARSLRMRPENNMV
ncbi:epf adjacent protein [Massilia sp. WF1]|uniref:elongation factor P maturation arginine rhamnosyltransferase EarP n=1 Tax=unclassified Massilia TaxID=2609279 RepID=UPI00064A085E|nr:MULTISPECIES: elongation factor P maturation arginine rhamnosyltransferase EarP [unclassified Massilia]ALK97996.1 epf adjacent protein [Massilia sp. WG5]KLU38267.1 epf adjacent protein [Massilia sp. WF1]